MSDDKSKSGFGTWIVAACFVAGFAGSLFFGWAVFPEMLYSQKKQPFNFNHQTHVDIVDDGCESCHFFRDDGSFSGIPKLAQCMDCHEEVQGDTPDEEVFVDEYVSNGQEVPWLVYSRQPDCVFFSHSAHVVTREMDCSECHGPIGESEESRVYEENRLTGYSRDIWGKNISGRKVNSWDRMKMNDCADCHLKETGHKGACFQCHK